MTLWHQARAKQKRGAGWNGKFRGPVYPSTQVDGWRKEHTCGECGFHVHAPTCSTQAPILSAKGYARQPIPGNVVGPSAGLFASLQALADGYARGEEVGYARGEEVKQVQQLNAQLRQVEQLGAQAHRRACEALAAGAIEFDDALRALNAGFKVDVLTGHYKNCRLRQSGGNTEVLVPGNEAGWERVNYPQKLPGCMFKVEYSTSYAALENGTWAWALSVLRNGGYVRLPGWREGLAITLLRSSDNILHLVDDGVTGVEWHNVSDWSLNVNGWLRCTRGGSPAT